MYEAARVTDPVCHTSALAGFLVGAVIGIALIATVAFATFTCGFGVALLAGLAAGLGASAILSLGESIGKMSAPFRQGDRKVLQFANIGAFTEQTVVKARQAASRPMISCGCHPP